MRGLLLALMTLLIALMSAGCAGRPHPMSTAEATQEIRPFVAANEDQWFGHAISYGPHRDGQQPGGPSPTVDQVREDLHLMLHHWKLLRTYGASGAAEDVLTVIRDEGLPLKVMLGAWIAPEAAAANRREVDTAIRLANQYPDIVVAVSVGNETQISWSAHRSPLPPLITQVRRLRAQVEVPVTVADDFNFWNKPESRALARELDFLTVHAHPLWNGLQLADALPWVQAQMSEIQSLHPSQHLVLGETGWATSVHDQGEQAQLIKGQPGELEQKIFHDAVRVWAESTRQTVFFFEAFDENWKGGEHPAEVEKHWGLFRADRSPKRAVAPQSSGR